MRTEDIIPEKITTIENKDKEKQGNGYDNNNWTPPQDSDVTKEMFERIEKLPPEQDYIESAGVFWLVWTPQGGHPKYKHSTRESAETEAERLAQQDPRRDFYVVKAQSLYKAEVLIKNTMFE